MMLIVAGLFLATGTVIAQEKENKEILETTTSKTYTVNMGNKMVKRSVEITTQRENTIEHKEEDVNKIDQTRVVDSMATITKIVKIDNDEDDAFDQRIVFSYEAKTPEDFVLVSNADELVVALDDGTGLKILEDMNLKSKQTEGSKATYIFTDEKGKNVEFYVEEYNKNWDANNTK